MSNAQPSIAGGHPVHEFGGILSFDNPAYQGWTKDSKLTDLAAKCQKSSTKALEIVDERKKTKAASTAEKKAAFEEEKRRWRKANGLKVDFGPAPKKTVEDREWEKMWMKEEDNKKYEKRKSRSVAEQQQMENDKLLEKSKATFL